MKLPITPIRLPLDLKEKAKEAAKKEYKTLTAWIIEAIVEKLNHKKKEK